MLRSKKLWTAAAVLVGAVVFLGAPTPAHAILTLRISTDSGANFTTFTATTENSGTVTGDVLFTDVGTGAVIEVSATGTTNQPGNFPTARVSQTNVSINNTNPAAVGVITGLVVSVTDNAFVQPPGGATANFSSSFSGTLGNNTDLGITATAGTFQSVADYTNNLFGGLPNGPVSGSFSSSSDIVLVPAVGTGTTSFSGGHDTTVTVGATPFSLSNEFRLTSLSVGAGSSLELTGITTLSAVPAPPTVVLALGGLPVLGIGQWLRRRQQV